MRLSAALATALVAAPSLAGPVRERSLQSILSGLLDHQEFLGGVFGDVVKDTLAEIDSAKEKSHKVVDDARRVIGDAGRTVEHWVEDGRDFIKKNNMICKSITGVKDMI